MSSLPAGPFPAKAGAYEDLPVVWPVHPRTRNFLRGSTRLRTWLEETRPHFRMIEPLGYLDMVAAEAASRLIVTDSGGVLLEALARKSSLISFPNLS